MQVEVEGVGLIDFPDDASDDEILSFSNRLTAPQGPQAPITEPPSTLRAPVRQTPFTESEFALADPEFGGVLSRMATETQPYEVMQRGVPGAVGITPTMIPSGKSISESELFQTARPFLPAAFMLAPGTTATIGSSVAKTGLGMADYLSSRQGITELVGSMTPARLLVLGKWAKDMAQGAGEHVGTLSSLIQKPNKTHEDWQAISDNTVGALAMIFGSGATAFKAKGEIGRIANELNMPEGTIPVESRFDTAQEIENRFRAARAVEAGSPFTLVEPPPQLTLPPGVQGPPAAFPISMGVRTQPPLSVAFDPQGRVVAETFDPSGLRLGEPVPVQAAPAPAPAPAVRQMRPIAPGMGEEILAPNVENVRAQRELEARQKGQDAVQQETAGVLRDVREPEVTQESTQQVPQPEGGAQVTQALKSKSYWHGTREKLEGALRPGLGKNQSRFLHEEGIWFAPNMGKDFETSTISEATRYSGDSGTIIEAEITIKNPYFGDVDSLVSDKINSKWLRDHGYDGFVDNISGSGLVAVLDSSQIKELSRRSSGKYQVPVSEGSPKAAEALNAVEWKDSDFSRYRELRDQQLKMQSEGKIINPKTGDFTPEWMANMREFEQLRNRHNGMPPIQISIADNMGLEYRGSLKAPGGREVWSFHDPQTGSNVGVNRGSTFEQAKQKVEASRSQFVEDVPAEPTARPEPEAAVESVTALDPRSGTALSATESLINRLESLKFAESGEGRLYSLPHPDAVRQIGKQLWNDTVDLTIAAIRAGKAIGQAIDDSVAFLKDKMPNFDEAKFRQNIQFVASAEQARRPAAPTAAEPPPTSVDPITGEPAKMITEKAAKAMESKVKIPAQADVAEVSEQIDLFNKEIGDALESGGRFLPKELRPDVAKGAPAEKGTVTNKQINQYFVNKLSSIRKQMQATKNKIAQQADIESQTYFDTLQKRFETAFRQVQELRRTSHEALFFWNKIRAEYQDIARAAGQMPEMKKQIPIIDQIWKDFRDGEYGQAGKHAVDYFRMNLFTPGSWTLDFGTNLIASAARIPAYGIMDIGAMITGRAPTRMFSAMRALQNGMRNWNPLGKRYRLPDQIEAELGTTAGGEFGKAGREVLVDFSEILKDRPELADKLRHIDKVIGAPIRMKRAVDSFFGRFGAAAELYHRAYIEGKSRGLKGDDLKTFAEEYVQNPPKEIADIAIKTGKELKFNRDLSRWEEAFSNNILTKLIVEAFPRWTLQFIRWGGEMLGVDPVFFKDVVTGKATANQVVNYLTKAATGWGGIYAFNQLAYDNVDANSMEYVKEDGNRVRLSGRTPAPELFFICALLRGDTEKAKAALKHLSVPGAKLLSGEPAGVLSPLIDTIRQSIEGRYTGEQTARELTKIVNDAIPGKSVLGFFRSIMDPTIREGIGAPIPGVASTLPQRVNPTTGEPLAPKTRIPGTGIELPTVGGTPFPGAERVLNDIESALLDHGLGLTRPRRTSIIDLPAEDVPKEVRREYEQLAGKNVKQMVGDVIATDEFKTLPFEVRREILQQLLSAARSTAKAEISEKYGASGRSIKSEPLNIQRLPERLRQ